MPYQAFATKDGSIIIAALNNTQFMVWRALACASRVCMLTNYGLGLQALCDKLRIPSVAEDPRFATNPLRVKHRQELVGLLGEEFRRETTAHWLGQLEGVLACGPINTIGQALTDAQVVHREMVQDVEHSTAGTIKVVGIPVKMSATKPSIRRAPPTLGQHTVDVLRNVLGYRDGAIEALQAKRVVA